MLPQVEPKLVPSWSQIGPCWPKLAPAGPHWPQVGPKLAQVIYVRGVHEGSASRALVFPDVHEGSASRVPTFACSFGLFHPLALDLKGCFFLVLLSACLVMATLSKQCIQKFLSSSSCRQLFLEVSSFFVHCTKALYKYMVRYTQPKQQERQQHQNLLWQFIQLSIPMPRDAKGLSIPPTLSGSPTVGLCLVHVTDIHPCVSTSSLKG